MSTDRPDLYGCPWPYGEAIPMSCLPAPGLNIANQLVLRRRSDPNEMPPPPPNQEFPAPIQWPAEGEAAPMKGEAIPMSCMGANELHPQPTSKTTPPPTERANAVTQDWVPMLLSSKGEAIPMSCMAAPRLNILGVNAVVLKRRRNPNEMHVCQ